MASITTISTTGREEIFKELKKLGGDKASFSAMLEIAVNFYLEHHDNKTFDGVINTSDYGKYIKTLTQEQFIEEQRRVMRMMNLLDSEAMLKLD